MVFTDMLHKRQCMDCAEVGMRVRDGLPDPLNVPDFSLNTQLALRPDLTRDLLDLGSIGRSASSLA